MTLTNYRWIKVDGGDFFEGNFHHWSDCFFSNPSIIDIIEFCNGEGASVEFLIEPTNKDYTLKDCPRIPMEKWTAKTDEEYNTIVANCCQ